MITLDEAIEILSRPKTMKGTPQDILEAHNMAITALRQPERQKGEWIDYTEDGYVECPFCHNATNCDRNKDELHFCFSCGADMREVE